MITALGLLILALMGTPLFIVIATGALLGFYFSDIDLQAIPIEYYRIINETAKERLGGLHSAKSLMVTVDFAEIEKLHPSGLRVEVFRSRQSPQ